MPLPSSSWAHMRSNDSDEAGGGISLRPGANELTGEGSCRPLVATSLSLRHPAIPGVPRLTFGMVGMGVCVIFFVFPL